MNVRQYTAVWVVASGTWQDPFIDAIADRREKLPPKKREKATQWRLVRSGDTWVKCNLHPVPREVHDFVRHQSKLALLADVSYRTPRYYQARPLGVTYRLSRGFREPNERTEPQIQTTASLQTFQSVPTVNSQWGVVPRPY